MIAIPRPLTQQDLPGLLAVQRACYGDVYLESAEVYARRLASPAQCSLVIEDAGRICAYLAAYAYASAEGKVTPLHGDFEAAEVAMLVLKTICGADGSAEVPLTDTRLKCRTYHGAIAKKSSGITGLNSFLPI